MEKKRILIASCLLLALTACSSLKEGTPSFKEWRTCHWRRTILAGNRRIAEVAFTSSSDSKVLRIYSVDDIKHRVDSLRRYGVYMKSFFRFLKWYDPVRHTQEDLRLSELVSQTFAHFSKKKDIVRKLGLSELEIVIEADGRITIDELWTFTPLLKYYRPDTLLRIFDRIAAFRYTPPIGYLKDTVGYVKYGIYLNEEANEWKRSYLRFNGVEPE